MTEEQLSRLTEINKNISNKLDKLNESQKKILIQQTHVYLTSIKKIDESLHNAMLNLLMEVMAADKLTTKSTNFSVPQNIPIGLADYIEVERGSKLSMPQIIKKVFEKLKHKNLIYEADKSIFRTDEETAEIFGLHHSVNDSYDCRDPNGFNFSTLVKYINNALLGPSKKRMRGLIDDLEERNIKYRKYDYAINLDEDDIDDINNIDDIANIINNIE